MESLRKAYKSGKLTMYLGAGVSVGSGLPSWEKLVLAMYFSGIKETSFDRRLNPFPNYLFAIAEWNLGRRAEPLDITARKVRNLYEDKSLFLEDLRHTLYAGFKFPGDQTIQEPQFQSLMKTNKTLGSVIKICKPSHRRGGVSAIVTYNYDDLLEFSLKHSGVPLQSIWSAEQKINHGRLPIYHVHGYIPMIEQMPDEEIIFTEEQYYLAAQNAYSWSNLIQIQCMSGSVGLMIGLSLKDRNMRRLLDAVRRTPIVSENYVLLQKPKWTRPTQTDLDQIHKRAGEHYKMFEESGIKTEERRYDEIQNIISQVESSDFEQEEAVLKALGVHPIWYDDHTEIPRIINGISHSR
jgi:hypothetical protein